MSIKTSIKKRISLVAVSALGIGLLSVSTPANAAVVADTNTYGQITVTLDNSNTTLAGRVGQQISIAVTGSFVAGGSTGNPTGAAGTFGGYSLATAITAQPATSAVYPTIAAPGATVAGTLNTYGVGLTAGSTILGAGSTSTGTATTVATINVAQSERATATTAAAAGTTLGTVTFTPTATGTYTLVVWNEKDRTYGAVSGTTSQATATTQASLSGNESSRTFTINVSNGVSSITLTRQASTSATFVTGSSGISGALIKVSLTDAAGNAAILAPGEAVTLTPTGTGDISQVNGAEVTSAAGAAYNLSAANFNSSGVAWINMTDATAGTTNLTAAIAGGANASTTITYVAVVKATSATPSGTATGVSLASGTTYNIPIGVSTVSWRASASTGSSVGFTVTERLIGGAGAITGYTTALSYDVAAASTGSLASVSVTATTSATGQAAYDIAADANVVDDATSGTESTATSATNTAGVLSITPTTVNAVVGASTTFTVNLKDLFRRNFANQTVTATVAGKNPTTLARTAATDASGNATFTFTDANTNTAVSDTITFSAGSSVVATVSYGTNTVGKLDLDWPNEDDVVAGTTFTEISAAAAGATGTSATVTAIVTGSSGALLAGVPVTFSVAGLTGAEVHTTKVTVYTGTDGKASTSISSYAAGKATVTAKAGTLTSTADIYFAQTGTDEARTIAATVSGSVVTATVKDRYGNTIPGVDVNATRTGDGYFGSGASTASGKTDKNGQVEFIFTGTGTVTVAFTSTTFGQSADAAGYVGGNATTGTAVTAAAAGTTSTNQTGLGAALAPAGVNSASVAVSSVNAAAAAADAAADAAAEAIDAANAATDAANLAAEAADAATVAAEEARDAADAATAAVEELATQVATLMAALKAQITTLANTVAKIAKKVKA